MKNNTPKIFFVDYGNYPFIKEAVSNLFEKGMDASYLYSSSFPSPNKSSTQKTTSSNDQTVIPITIKGQFKKYSFIKRRYQEIEWARNCCATLDEHKPNIVVVANAPLEVLKLLNRWCRKNNSQFVFWMQDVHGIAIQKILSRKIPFLGNLIGLYYISLENRLLRNSDHVILISKDHRSVTEKAKVNSNRISVLENWALIDIPHYKKNNDWSQRLNLHNSKNIIYSGTLGLKHNPNLLLELAKYLQNQNDIFKVVVISEGIGADWLKLKQQELNLQNLVLLPFQDYQDVPKVLATADVLTAILEPDASTFSVPSKILTYLCAGKPILAAVPQSNLSARMLKNIAAGLVADPNDVDAYIKAAIHLISLSATETESMGKRARSYAEEHFNPDIISSKLTHILNQVSAL
jgi:glycosyltransferase involved in cell wall biosynthesis